jgi:hypothetical protein
MALLLPGSAFPELVHRMPFTPRRTVHLVLVLFYLLSFVYRVLCFPILLLADILADLSSLSRSMMNSHHSANLGRSSSPDVSR